MATQNNRYSAQSGLNFSELQIVSCKLANDEIKDSIKSITIYESINNKLLRRTVLFKDADSIFKKYLDLVIGEVTIDIKLTTTIDPTIIDVHFLVENYSQIVTANNESSHYLSLNLMDVEYNKFTLEYSTFMTNKSGSDFIAEFSKNVLNKTILTLEYSPSKLTKTFPYQKFKYILKYLNQYLVSKDGFYNYIYFSDLQNTHFATLSFLSKQPPIHIFSEVSKPVFENRINKNFFCEYDILNKNSIKDGAKTCALGSTRINFNSSDKSVTETPITDYNDINAVGIGGRYLNFDKTLINAKHKTYYASSEGSNVNKLAMNRSLYNTGDKIFINEIEGDITRSVGRTASLIFKNDDITKQYNQSLSGNYLISEITHYIYPKAYKQDIVFIRNAKNNKSSSNQYVLSKFNGLTNTKV